jgi:dolichol-phosphate mannosyltransferase
MKLSILIPVYNEEKTIIPILEKVESVVLPGISKEIVVVNDGSTDKTAERINDQKELRSQSYRTSHLPKFVRRARSEIKDKSIKVITHEENSGKGTAIQTGIQHSTGDYIIIQDADLEYDPQDIPKLLQPIIEKRARVVYGTRLHRLPRFHNEEKKPRFFLHYIGNRFLSLVTSMCYGQWITDMETCYKLFPRKAVVHMNLSSRRFDFEPEITAKLLKCGYKIFEIPITTTPRGYDEGKKLNTFRDGCVALWTLVKYRFVD